MSKELLENILNNADELSAFKTAINEKIADSLEIRKIEIATDLMSEQNDDLMNSFFASVKKRNPNATMTSTADLKAKTQDMLAARAANQPAKPEISPEEKTRLLARKKELEGQFDPEYQRSDDPSVFNKHSSIAAELSHIHKMLSENALAGHPAFQPVRQPPRNNTVGLIGNARRKLIADKLKYKSPPNSKGGQLPTDKSPPNSKGGQVNEMKSSNPKGIAYKITAASHAANPSYGPHDPSVNPKTNVGAGATRSSAVAGLLAARRIKKAGGNPHDTDNIETISTAIHGSPSDYGGVSRGWSKHALTSPNQTPEQKQRRSKLTGKYSELSNDEKEKDRQIAKVIVNRVSPVKEDVQQIDEVGNTEKVLNAVRQVGLRAAKVKNDWEKTSNTLEQPPRHVVVADRIISAAKRRVRGQGPNPVHRNTVMARDAYFKSPQSNLKYGMEGMEEALQIDEGKIKQIAYAAKALASGMKASAKAGAISTKRDVRGGITKDAEFEANRKTAANRKKGITALGAKLARKSGKVGTASGIASAADSAVSNSFAGARQLASGLKKPGIKSVVRAVKSAAKTVKRVAMGEEVNHIIEISDRLIANAHAVATAKSDTAFALARKANGGKKPVHLPRINTQSRDLDRIGYIKKAQAERFANVLSDREHERTVNSLMGPAQQRRFHTSIFKQQTYKVPDARYRMAEESEMEVPSIKIRSAYTSMYGKMYNKMTGKKGAQRLATEAAYSHVGKMFGDAALKGLKAYHANNNEERMDEKAPPGKESVVKALKKKFAAGGLTDSEKAKSYAIAWSQYNREKSDD